MTGYLLDTNVVSEFRKGSRADQNVRHWLESTPEDELYISPLALGEIRRGIERARIKDPRQAAAIEQWLLRITSTFAGKILQTDAAVADRWGRLSAARPLSTADALMAATAMVHGLTLVTRNTKDIESTGVSLRNPFQEGG